MRRHDLDWLRVLVFGLLIFYHVGMFFVTPDADWHWHIKNNVTMQWIKIPMRLVNQWRLPLLFVISGMGTYFALKQRNAYDFAIERTKKLFVPLVVGMLVVIPPQSFVEGKMNGSIIGGYLGYWPWKLFGANEPIMNLDWHHLWFLPFLLAFSLILLPILIYLRKRPTNRLSKLLIGLCSRKLGLYWVVLPLFLLESLVEPFTENFRFINGIFLFFTGFMLMSVGERFWEIVEKNRKLYLIVALLGFSIFLLITLPFEDGIIRHFSEAFVTTTTFWSWILCFFGYASKYLNRPSRSLDYFNQAVYPFYILHQTVTVLIGYLIWNLSWPIMVKFIVMVAGTFLFSALIYEFLIRRWKITRPLFGLKENPVEHNKI